LDKIKNVSEKMKKFISALLTLDFEKRIDYKSICQHEIFNSVDEPKFHSNKKKYEGFYEDFEKN
jgi:predicted transcriptional regulator